MAVREGLLALLDEGARRGYQLKTGFEDATGGVWPLNVGQVYTTLDRLERDGLVVVETSTETDGTAPEKIYTITAAGREELGAWWTSVPSDDPPPRDELMLKTLMAIEHDRTHALSVITKHRTALTQLLQRRRRERKALATPETIASALVTDALVVRAEADLRWLDLCEARLGSSESKGTPT
jgi:DNA-binding PadR family transcriptional regulator